jgi:hypothetical protein
MFVAEWGETIIAMVGGRDPRNATGLIAERAPVKRI